MECSEWAAHLRVSEVAVPLKFNDGGQPAYPPRHPGNWIKADENFRADSCGHTLETAGWVCGKRARRRRKDARVFNPRAQAERHEVRKICRVGEESEDQLYGKWNPLAGLEALGHEFDVIAVIEDREQGLGNRD